MVMLCYTPEGPQSERSVLNPVLEVFPLGFEVFEVFEHFEDNFLNTERNSVPFCFRNLMISVEEHLGQFLILPLLVIEIEIL